MGTSAGTKEILDKKIAPVKGAKSLLRMVKRRKNAKSAGGDEIEILTLPISLPMSIKPFTYMPLKVDPTPK